MTLPGSQTLTTEQLDDMLTAINEAHPENNFEQNEVSNVNATIGKEFLFKSLVALVAACVLILAYVAFRFRKIGGLKAGSTAIVALLHDMFVVFGVFVILRIPLNGNFIAAVLTILATPSTIPSLSTTVSARTVPCTAKSRWAWPSWSTCPSTRASPVR